MAERLKNLSSWALGIVLLLAILCVPAVFILGTTWAANNVLRWLIGVCWLLLAVDILLLLTCVVRRFRGAVGVVIYLSSYIFGLTSWLVSFVVTYELWGTWAVVAGVLLFGGAVVPFALLAALFGGLWLVAASVVALFTMTFATRIGGMMLAER